MVETGIRLAFLVPAQNTVLEPEIYRMAPQDVTVHFERLVPKKPLPDGSPKSIVGFLMELGEDASRAAKVMTVIDPKVIAFGCTSGSFFKGIKHDEELIQTMEAASGISAITASTAAIKALDELKLKKVCLISPYPDFFNEKAKDFLAANGLKVHAMGSLKTTPGKTALQGPEVAYDLAKRACSVDCDGVFCSCTEFRTIEILESFEKDLNKPMISANQATMWLALKRAGFKRPIAGFGQLLTHL
jgi:maleate isomerase